MSDLGYFFIFKFTEIILLSEMPSFDIVQILSFLLLSNFPVDTQRWFNVYKTSVRRQRRRIYFL